MITINNFEILNGGTQLAIDVETNVGYFIESILFWEMDKFKDYSLAINLSSFMSQINNKEVLIINASDIGVLKFQDICFIEVESTYTEVGCSTCTSPATGITYNLAPYYTCLFGYLADLSANQCLTCNKSESSDIAVTINLLIDNVVKAVEIGYYSQAIDMINKLKKLCSSKLCSSCPTIECTTCNDFIQI